MRSAIAFDLDGTLDPCERNPRTLLEWLRERYRLALVSNGSSSGQRAKLARLGIEDAFDAIVISGEVGCHKPSRRIFLEAAGALGVTPADMIFVGDDPLRDIAPAQRLGMAGYWVSRGRPWRRRLPPERSAADVFGFWEMAC